MSTEENKVKLGYKEIEIKPLTTREFLEVVKLIMPYTKTLRDIKQIYYSDSTDNIFYYDLVIKFIEDLPYGDLYKILGLLYKMNEDELLDYPFTDLLDGLLVIIRVNKLLEIIMMGKLLGVIDA